MNLIAMSCGAHPTKPNFLLCEIGGQKFEIYRDMLGKFGRFLSSCVKRQPEWEAHARGTMLKKAKPPAKRKTRSPKRGAQTKTEGKE